jgi:hypothetical protein
MGARVHRLTQVIQLSVAYPARAFIGEPAQVRPSEKHHVGLKDVNIWEPDVEGRLVHFIQLRAVL